MPDVHSGRRELWLAFLTILAASLVYLMVVITRRSIPAAGELFGHLIGVVLAGLFYGGAMFSPGALNAQTGQAVLGGVTSRAQISQCSSCHAVPLSGQTMAAKCLDCHTDLVRDPNNFHNVMVTQTKNTGCNGCHTDHGGPSAALTVLNLTAFPHSQVGFSLQAHQKMADGSPFQCSGCHTKGYIGFEQAVCTDCHTTLDAAFTQGHTALFGSTCLSCHDGGILTARISTTRMWPSL
jgi:hypothetical protein